ncbi:MAG TPA: NAD(P)-binding domain-containing protein, partial [Acetomicrobium sp.]|nr:NAD(P)-binding domain-containing protein [Acetomicrobium sp.]
MLGFIGGGAMAEALLRGILAKGLVQPDKVWVSDIDANRLSYLKESLGVQTTASNTEILEKSRIIF